MYVIPEWIPCSAGGPAGPWGPTQRGPSCDSGWRNGSRPSLLLDRTARPEHPPPSQAGPSLLLPETGYRTEHLRGQRGTETTDDEQLLDKFQLHLLSPNLNTIRWTDCMRHVFSPMVFIFCVTRRVSAPTLAAAAAASVPAWPPPTTMTSYCCLARWPARLETRDRKCCRAGGFFFNMLDVNLLKSRLDRQTFKYKR